MKTLRDYYYIEGNYFSKNIHSYEEALKASKTLVECTNCIDCYDCIFFAKTAIIVQIVQVAQIV